MASIRALVISLALLCVSVNAAELLLSFEPVQGRLLVLVANETDKPFILTEDFFRISANGRLYFEFKNDLGQSYKLAALLNDRLEPSEIKVDFGSVVGKVFYMKHLLSDYDVSDKGEYLLTAYLCENSNALYQNMVLERDKSTCLISNKIELKLD